MKSKDIIIHCKGILFDLDGVLLDSTSCIERHWEEWAKIHELDLRTVLQNAHGVRTIETILKVAPHLDVEKEASEFTANEILDTDGVVAIPGALNLLGQLEINQWAIVTSGGYDLVQARLKRAGLPKPTHIITGDDVSHGKPSPEPYLLGAAKLGLAMEECVVIEDAPIGVKAGKTAGMRVVGITSTHSIHELSQADADFIIENINQIQIFQNKHTDTINISLTTL